MITHCAPPRGGTLPLGRQGENEARQIVFDVSGWAELYGDGTVVLLHQRKGDSDPYPVAIAQDDATVTWTVSSADTANPGRGKAELQYIVGDTLAKSCIYSTRTDAALGEPTEALDPETGWVTRLLEDINWLITTGMATITFDFDPDTGELSYTTLDNFTGIEFAIDDNGYLEAIA